MPRNDDTKSFAFVRSYYENLQDLERLGSEYEEYIDALCLYAFEGIVPDNMSRAVKLCFNSAKYIIDNKKAVHESAVERGKKGGAPKGNQNARKHERSPIPELAPDDLFDKFAVHNGKE